jgi:hypothetical protein
LDKDFEEKMNEIISEKAAEISGNIIINSEYKKQKEIEMKLLNAIRDLLPDDKKHLIIELNDVSNYMSTIAEGLMYKYGLKDGIKFRRYML